MFSGRRGNIAASLQLRSSARIEWAWIVGRLAIVGLATIGGVLFLRHTAAFAPLMGLLGFVLAYNAGEAGLLWLGKPRVAFLGGFVLDNLVLLAGWWTVASVDNFRAPAPTNDLYLIIFPVVIIGAVRLGPALAALYTGAWEAWIALVSWHFYGPGSYDVQQLPIRMLALAISGGLVMWIVSQRDGARREERAITGQYEALFRTMSDAVLVASPEGKLLDLNLAAASMLQRRPEELRGMPVETFLPADDQARFGEAFQQALRGEQVTQDVKLVRLDRQLVPVEIRASSAKFENRLVWLGVARDLTERTEMEKQLLRTERMRVMGQIASGIAHDVNNALTPIIGYSELLVKSDRHRTNPEYLGKALDIIHTSAQDATSMVSRLRDFYRERSEHEKLSPVDMNHEVEQVVDLAELRRRDQQALQEGVAIELVSDPVDGPAIVSGREEELRQAVLNLVFNAMDALPAGGRISVSTERAEADVVVQVKDTGVGMSPETLARCTEPFFTTKGRAGTGLGLAMVQGCVRRHQGTLDIQSEIGQGTVVSMRLPVHEDASEGQGTPQVLVVDDDASVRELLSEYLSTLGYEAETAASAEEALGLLDSGGIRLVLTDLAMGGMNGVELGTEVKKRAPGTPVIIITGFQDLVSSAGESLWESVDMVLNKPVTMSMLEDAIASVFKGAAPVT